MIVSSKSTGHFTIVPNKILQNSGLSLQAMGLCAYILSLPKNWHINITHLTSELGVSKNTLYKYLKELIQAGVLKKAQVKDERGKWCKEGVYFIGDFTPAVSQNLGNGFADENATKQSQAGKLAVSQNLGNGFADENATKQSQAGKLAVSQNLTTINKEYINTQEKQSARDHKSQKAKTYILTSIDQKRLLSLCFAKAPKEASLENLALLSKDEQDAFHRFISYRQERGRVSLSTKEAILREFIKLKNVGQDLSACVEQSIMRGYVGIFAVHKARFEPKCGANSKPIQSPSHQSKEILGAILKAYPAFDFTNIAAFCEQISINGRSVGYKDGVYFYKNPSDSARAHRARSEAKFLDDTQGAKDSGFAHNGEAADFAMRNRCFQANKQGVTLKGNDAVCERRISDLSRKGNAYA